MVYFLRTVDAHITSFLRRRPFLAPTQKYNQQVTLIILSLAVSSLIEIQAYEIWLSCLILSAENPSSQWPFRDGIAHAKSAPHYLLASGLPVSPMKGLQPSSFSLSLGRWGCLNSEMLTRTTYRAKQRKSWSILWNKMFRWMRRVICINSF
jgi:hypothetical protein